MAGDKRERWSTFSLPKCHSIRVDKALFEGHSIRVDKALFEGRDPRKSKGFGDLHTVSGPM